MYLFAIPYCIYYIVTLILLMYLCIIPLPCDQNDDEILVIRPFQTPKKSSSNVQIDCTIGIAKNAHTFYTILV